jgi:hypothetical protein
MIYLCQQRQEWNRDFARSERISPLPFVGSVTLQCSIEATAEAIRNQLGFDVEVRRQFPSVGHRHGFAVSRLALSAKNLGGHLKSGHVWSLENRL